MYEEYRIGEITMSDRTEYISRQAAIDAIVGITNRRSLRELYEYVVEHDLKDRWSGGLVDAADAVIGLPSAHARWEYVDYSGVGNWHCTACHAIGSKSYKYCPNCGAIMDKPTD